MIASQDLCIELYDQLGWDDTYFYSYRHRQGSFDKWDISRKGIDTSQLIPRYDFAYIWDRLPNAYDGYELIISSTEKGVFAEYLTADYTEERPMRLATGNADNPTDAIALLATKLLKMGILKKENL